MNDSTLTGNSSLCEADFANPPKNPLVMMENWIAQAERLNITEPRGLVLSTVDDSNEPSSRVVLLKQLDDTGVVFGTSEMSQKGKDIKNNPMVAGTLWWRESMQQINIKGFVTQLPNEKSDEFFKQRTRQAQAATALSQQSTQMIDVEALRRAIINLTEGSQPILRPETWHAYHIAIEVIEFWQVSKDRLHHRLRFDLINGLWVHKKLQP